MISAALDRQDLAIGVTERCAKKRPGFSSISIEREIVSLLLPWRP